MLIDTIARELFDAYRDGRRSIAPHRDIPPWDQLDEEKRAGWITAAGRAKDLHDSGQLALMERRVSRAMRVGSWRKP